MGYSAEDLSEYTSMSDSDLSEELAGARWSWGFVRNEIRIMRANKASTRDVDNREFDLTTIMCAIRKIIAAQALRKPVEVPYYRPRFEQSEDGEWLPVLAA